MDVNQEMLAVGWTNILGSFVQAIPVTHSLSRWEFFGKQWLKPIFVCFDQGCSELRKWCSNPNERTLHRRSCHPLPRFPDALLCLYPKGDKSYIEFRNISGQNQTKESEQFTSLVAFLFHSSQPSCIGQGRGALYCQAFWTGGHHASVRQLKERGSDGRTMGHICNFLYRSKIAGLITQRSL